MEGNDCLNNRYSITLKATFVPSEARPKAEPGSNGGPKAQSCDLGAKRSGIGTAKVKKKF